MSPQPRAARTAHVHDDIRLDILTGKLAPSEPLRIAAFATEFGVSMAVIREALIRLSEQGLVAFTPNQGFRVTDISPTDLQELTDLRIHNETLALRRSIEHADMNWEARVVAAHHILDRLPYSNEGEENLSDEWSHAHLEFHLALVSGCGSQRLEQLTTSLRESSEVYHRLSHARFGAKRDIRAEHRQLMELATARDVEGATNALAEHIRATADNIVESLLNSEDYR